MWPFSRKKKQKIIVEVVTLASDELEIASTLVNCNCKFEVIGSGFDHAGVEYRPGINYSVENAEMAALLVNWARHTRDLKLPDGTLQKARPALIRYWED